MHRTYSYIARSLYIFGKYFLGDFEALKSNCILCYYGGGSLLERCL